MKKMILLLLALVSSFGIFAQNIFFVDFATRYAEVQQRMEDHPCVEVVQSIEDEVLVVHSIDAEFTYQFNQGWLYRIEMVRHIDDIRAGRKAYQESEAYFRVIQAQQLSAPVDERSHRARVFARTGRIFHLEYEQIGKKEAELTLISTSTVNQPVYESEWVAPEVRVDWSRTLTLGQ